jgi:hypothetical protein
MGFRLMVSCPGAEKEKVALCARQTKLKQHVAQSTPGQSGRIERQCVAEYIARNDNEGSELADSDDGKVGGAGGGG